MNREQRRAVRRNPPWGAWFVGELPEITEAMIIERARHSGVAVETVRDTIASMRATETILLNTVYQVNLRRLGGTPPVVWLSIKRRDKAPLGAEHFRDLQRIKNELAGAEIEAVELYPAESRLVDTANQYHLWCVADPAFRFPFGFNERMVLRESGAGAVQQPFAEDDV